MTLARLAHVGPLAALTLAVLFACAREKPSAADGTMTVAALAVVAPPAPAVAGKDFGADCVEDGQCASAVCFHKRLRTAQSGAEGRGQGDALERDGYCSLRCDGDTDCPSPPSNGHCGARGMCKRSE